jgi:hypothetical protein
LIHYRHVALAAGAFTLSCTDTPQQPSSPRSPNAALTAPPPAIMVGAGDIAGCPSNYRDEATARILDTIPGTVFTLGDAVYEDGTAAEFANCYAPSWGRHRTRTRPAIGNHEYHNSGFGYFGYFGNARSRPLGKAYYSYNLGDWHIVVLDSERTMTEQATWLKADLAANRRRCTMAYLHQPIFSTGDLLPPARLKPLYTILYNAGADVVVTGHNHIYERFKPQNPAGQADWERGLRAFVVGTGGAPLLPMRATTPNLEVRQNHTHGVIKFTLYWNRYRWDFIPVAGKTWKDSGTTVCH